VYTLPGLELVSSGSLTAAAGWPWEWDGRHSAGRLPHVIAATRHGHLALLGPNSELARFALWSRAAAPAPPVSTYDWDMAAAAQAAVTAFEQMKAFSKAQAANNAAAKGAGAAAAADPAGKPAAQTQQAGVQEAGEEGGEGGGGGRRGGVQMPKDFKGFMTKIGQDFQRAGGEVAKGFQKALDETQKGLQKVAQVSAPCTVLAAAVSRHGGWPAGHAIATYAVLQACAWPTYAYRGPVMSGWNARHACALTRSSNLGLSPRCDCRLVTPVQAWPLNNQTLTSFLSHRMWCGGAGV
jgi:hypothetical protein